MIWEESWWRRKRKSKGKAQNANPSAPRRRATNESQKAKPKSQKPYLQNSLPREQGVAVLQFQEDFLSRGD